MTSSEPPESVVQTASHSFLRSLVATQYLLGARRDELTTSLLVEEGQAEEIVERCQLKLSQGAREDRARYLARQVTRIIRSLRAQRLG